MTLASGGIEAFAASPRPASSDSNTMKLRPAAVVVGPGAPDEAEYPLHHAGHLVDLLFGVALPALLRGRGPPSYTSSTRNVYAWCMAKMRTNIEIEEAYLQAVMDRYGLRTKTEAVDFALRHLAGQPMTRDEALAMRGAGAIGKVPADRRPAAS